VDPVPGRVPMRSQGGHLGPIGLLDPWAFGGPGNNFFIGIDKYLFIDTFIDTFL